MNLELNKISTDNVELRTDIQNLLNKHQKMMGEYQRLTLAMQNATNESYQLTSDCSESFANRYKSH
jgi:predicted  nucleic acid-binding Zn-ribbon protein